MEWYIRVAWWVISTSDTQDYFEFIIKKYETFVNNPPEKTYIKKNWTSFKTKTGNYLELLTPWTINLLGNTEN